MTGWLRLSERGHGRLVTAAAIVFALSGGALLTAAGYQAYHPGPPGHSTTRGDPTLGVTGRSSVTHFAGRSALPRSVPVRIAIPAIDVRARLVTLGQSASGAPDVPGTGTVAGWYRRSPAPGQRGAAVIAGHVDWTDGPAVFYRLGALRPGDEIRVARKDGRTAVFTVHATGEYPKTDLPTSLIYGRTADPQLRLITCGGAFAGEHYVDNVVVYAHLTAVR